MPEKILIVDDDAEFRQELRDYLQDYQVVEAANGMEALRIINRANEIGVVILDVMMPRISGTEVLSEIKKIEPDLGIIILTGHSSKDVAIEALKNRADEYLEKPSSIESLKEIIEKLLSKRNGEAEIDTANTEGKVLKVRRFIEKNCFKKTTLKEAAEAVCLSPKYLSRVFKEETGAGFNEYKLKIKIGSAKELLGKSGCNVNQISDKLGYENAESFIRQFRKLTRQTPSEFRRKLQGKRKKKAPRTR
ncbi:MAG: response regulator [Candidatus Omnitrophica bacterium]|nr:response regulator [Candidatus Omnitrophota bacterium]MDD5552249.1 response regulator [Candidatus Omnitrophota bacterium]